MKVEAAETAVPPLVLTPASEAASSGGPGVRLTEGPGARQAERGAGAAGVKEEAGEKRKQTPEMEVGEAQAQAKPKMEERSGSTFLEHVREVMQSLVSMRARLVEAARSTSSAEAAALLEDQVDYGDDDDVDIEAASQALSAGGDAKAVQLLQLLRDEQQKLAAQVEALAAATRGGAGAGEDELVERAWVALQSRDAEEAERLLKELPPSTVANMKDASGVTPLHVSARERWIGLTAWLLEAAPSLATATTFSRQPPRWTALMSLANMPRAADEAVADREAEVVRMLLEHMPLEAINIQSENGATVTHLAVPKGNRLLTQLVL